MTNFVLSPIDPNLLINSIVERTASEVIRKLSEKEFSESDRWFDLNELCVYHPDKPAHQTVYGWVQKRTIPFHKTENGKRLRFLKSEIDAYLKEGKGKTYKEVSSDITEYLSQVKIKNNNTKQK